MLLDENLATLIQHTSQNFHIAPDKLAVGRINDSLSTLEQARNLRIREAESALKKLSRSLTTLKNNHASTLETHSPSSHASTIASLDTQKFKIAKSATDLEIDTERLGSQLADLQARLAELEGQGVEGGERQPIVDSEVGLKLAVYRAMGMEAVKEGKDGGKGGEYNKIVVRNDRSGDVHVVNFENGKLSRWFYANHFWSIS